MSKFVRKTVIVANTEVTPGTDIVPGASNGILVRNPVLTPLELTSAERNLVRGYFGNYDAIVTMRKVKVTFEVEWQGSGTLGTPPAYDPLLTACGTLGVSSITAPTNAAFATSTTGGTLAAATYFYRVSALYPGGEGLASAETSQITTGSTSTVTVNWGAVAGAIGYNIYGRTTGTEQYLGTVNGATLTFVDTGAITPSGPLPAAAQAGYGYGPVSGTGKTLSIYYQIDGLWHKMVYARGNVTLKIKANDIPFLAFEFIALDTGAIDSANLAPTNFPNFKTPLAANKLNTPVAQVFGIPVALESLDFNFGNVNQQVSRIGSEQILHTDRKVVGSVMFEMTSVATKDWLTAVKTNALGTLLLQHGTVSGLIARIFAGNVELQTPTFSDVQGIQMVQFQLRANPTFNGNDEFGIAVL